MRKVLVVESPNKVKKLSGFLDRIEPGAWRVVATVGHFRGLPEMGSGGLAAAFDPRTLHEHFVVQKPDVGARLSGLLSQADQVYLATDPDREGEAIAWHVAEHCRLRSPLRVTFTEITEKALAQALMRPRALDRALIDAQRARQVLDYAFGLVVSRALWRFGCRSAGRVQSAALRIVVEREATISAFAVENYYTLEAAYAVNGTPMRAALVGPSSPAAAVGARSPSVADAEVVADAHEDAEADEDTGVEGQRLKTTALRFSSQRAAEDIRSIVSAARHVVSGIEEKESTRRPPAPFVTATLQAEASQQLGFSPDVTARLAQQLFEQGLVTYIRTDSTEMSEEACAEVAAFLQAHHPQAASSVRQQHNARAGAQAGHECIRPTHIADRGAALTGDEQKLYRLIWHRAVCSQARSMRVATTDVTIAAEGTPHTFLAHGTVVLDPGFTALERTLARELGMSAREATPLNGSKAVGTSAAEKRVEQHEQQDNLPRVQQGQQLLVKAIDLHAGRTRPPAHFTEATLIRSLERRSIGRPSTYATIFQTLFGRGYLTKQNKHLLPTDLGVLCVRLLCVSFEHLTREGFTKDTEGTLDQIADAKKERVAFLGAFLRMLEDNNSTASVALQAFALAHPGSDAERPQMHATACACGGAREVRVSKFGRYARCVVCARTADLEPKGQDRAKSTDSKPAPKVLKVKCPACSGVVIEAVIEAVIEVKSGSRVGRPGAAKRPTARSYRCQSCAFRSEVPPPKEAPLPCPICGGPATRLIGTAGGAFWGCAAYPVTGCRGTRPVPAAEKKRKATSPRAPANASAGSCEPLKSHQRPRTSPVTDLAPSPL